MLDEIIITWLITVILPLVAVASVLVLLPFVLFSGLMLERYERFYNAFILGLLSVLSLDFAFASELLGYKTLYKLGELASLVLFIAAGIVVVKNSAVLFVLSEANKRLDEEVKKKTAELEARLKELSDSRTALMHILSDLDRASKALQESNVQLAALHEIDQGIISGMKLEDMLNHICELMVKTFNVKMSWIGLVEEGSFDVKPAGNCGFEEGYLSSIKVKGDDSEYAQGPTGRAIKTKKTAVMAHIDSDPAYAPWRDAALQRGYRSSAAIPLIYGSDVLGAINVYSERPDAFDEALIARLENFASQASIAIAHARLLEKNREAHEQLLKAHRELDDSHKKLETAYAELSTVDKLKSDIISNVSHELRTPITIADSAIELALEDAGESLKSILTMAHNALRRQNEIVENLLKASEFYKGKIELVSSVFSINEVIDEIKNEMKAPASEKGVAIEVNQKEKIAVFGDREKLKRAIKNIVDNGIKFNKKDGKVIISLRREGGMLKLAVEDTGMGIAPAHLDKVFKPLYQIDPSATRKYGGTGMGLAVAKQMVALHKGDIKVESEVGKGSRFIVELPINI